MSKRIVISIVLVSFCLGFSLRAANSQSHLSLEWNNHPVSVQSPEKISFDFNGYTNRWHREEWDWVSARGLFNLSQPSVQSEIWAMEEEIGNQLLLEELWIQPGFIKELSTREITHLESPTQEDLEKALSEGDVMVTVVDQDPVASSLLERLPEEFQFRRNRAFFLQSDDKTVFVLASHSQRELDHLRKHIGEAVDIVRQYDLHRGIPGIQTNFLHITTTMRHNPFDLINLSLRLGCDWLIVRGFNDWMIPGPVNEALESIGFPFTFISGQYVTGGVLYGMENYPDVQDNTIEQSLEWAEEHGGYYFGGLSESEGENSDRFDGFQISGPSDLDRIEELDAAFVTQAGDITSSIPPSMVLFLEKGMPLTQESVMEAIVSRRSFAVFEKGTVAGPSELRDGMRILLLEGACLEDALGRPISIEAKVEGQGLDVTLRNRTEKTIDGNIELQPSAGIVLREGASPRTISLPANTAQKVRIPLTYLPEASGRDNPIGIRFSAPGVETRALAHVDLPRAVELHPMIVDVPGEISYPVTVYNYTDDAAVSLEVYIEKEGLEEPTAAIKKDLVIPPGENKKVHLSLELEEGRYQVEGSALGVANEGLILIESQTKTATAREEDLDGDGIPEIVMENDQIRATVLLFGGRVIEYIVKSQDENLMFKLWPEKPPMDGKVGGTRSFYPYGGLEEFTGYPYIGGHIVFKHEILKESGASVRVKVWANIHGSLIAKEYTLFADSPLLEARYEMDEMTPSINVIGINPLFEIGPSTGPEDRYYFPEEELVETIPELERYYGRGVFPKEGWAAGYDTEQDISLLIGYPVNDAIYLHLWNNHPDNTPTPYYYTELQPWLELKHGTSTYFTYYVYGKSGNWEAILKEIRDVGIVTERQKSDPWDLD